MTLSIDQVRDCKFHLARRNGYEPVDVDNFVDQVEETLVSLNAELDGLRRQVAAGGSEGVPAEQGPDLAERDAEIERLKGEIERLQGELTQAREGESADVISTIAELKEEIVDPATKKK